MHRRTAVAALLLLTAPGGASRVHAAPAASALPLVASNDNRIAAGTLRDGVLSLALEIREAAWRPLGASAPTVPILAFAERGHAPENPGPLIRVQYGTTVAVQVTNASSTALVVHGFSARRVVSMDTLVVPAGATRAVRFRADAIGTYYYWAAPTGVSFMDRNYEGSQLAGALVVDPAGATPRDRIFVIERYSPGVDAHGKPDRWGTFFTFNGRPWPFTERLRYTQGDSVRWRIVNASNDVHPLHLHGFFFRVSARGDARQDTLLWPAQRTMNVTDLVFPGATLDLAWHADRPGGWIFHCHLNWHVVPNPGLGPAREPDSTRMHHVLFGYPMHDMQHHASEGMGGLVLGVRIAPTTAARPELRPYRRLRLFVESDSQPGDSTRRFGYALDDGSGAAGADSMRVPGPPIVLHVGEPTSIWVYNRATEPTQVHWHGLEIESPYDGVAGFSGTDRDLAPLIAPGDSFEVRVTPPRAGSFMYHTHVNDIRQQSHGLYGPLIVLDSGATWDEEHDRLFQAGSDPDDNPILGGSRSPAPIQLRAGTTYRFRLMNVTMGAPGLQFWLVRGGALAQWTPLAKDGYSLDASRRVPTLARQPVSIGETYDFAVTPATPGPLALELRTFAGKLLTRQELPVAR